MNDADNIRDKVPSLSHKMKAEDPANATKNDLVINNAHLNSHNDTDSENGEMIKKLIKVEKERDNALQLLAKLSLRVPTEVISDEECSDADEEVPNIRIHNTQNYQVDELFAKVLHFECK